MAAYLIEVHGEFLIETDDLEGIKPILERQVARDGLLVLVDQLRDDDSGDDADREPTCLDDLNLAGMRFEWNPLQAFEHSAS